MKPFLFVTLEYLCFIYRYDDLNTTNNKIPKNWFTSIDGQIKSERDSYSLRIMEAEHNENWKGLAKWSGKVVAEYPTYYNYYRPRGIALHKIGEIESASVIRSSTKLVRKAASE